MPAPRSIESLEVMFAILIVNSSLPAPPIRVVLLVKSAILILKPLAAPSADALMLLIPEAVALAPNTIDCPPKSERIIFSTFAMFAKAVSTSATLSVIVTLSTPAPASIVRFAILADVTFIASAPAPVLIDILDVTYLASISSA